uniref:Putative secreted protein n=1 Tax=Xenopsylla cheopis TaxID=163159 RepID=A0A6M2DV46_XENCH
MLAKGTNKTTQPATCLMVLLLSMALIAVPSLRPGGSSIASQQELAAQQRQQAEAQQRGENFASTRRSLLYTTPQGYMEEPIDEELNMDDLLTFHSDHDYPVIMKRAVKAETTSNAPRKRALMDLPVDDTWPPPKMKKYDKDQLGIFDGEDVMDMKTEVEYDYFYPDGTLEPDGVVNMYDPLEDVEMLDGPNQIYTISGKIGELMDVSLPKVSVANDNKNKSAMTGASQVVVQV